MRIAIIGDIIGSPGRDVTVKYLKKYGENFDFIIINGENAAGGFGITEKIADGFFEIGVDVITSGNHIWDKREIYPFLQKDKRILRPLNYPKGAVGRGYDIYSTKSGETIAVMNLEGRVFMNELDSPFEKSLEAVNEIQKITKNIVIDFHAEATSEKLALAWYLDGKASMVYGTHTHVLTADNRILPQGTGYITDVGMSGGFDGIIGMKREAVIERFLTSMPSKFEVCAENVRINGVIIELNSAGKCTSIERIDYGINEI